MFEYYLADRLSRTVGELRVTMDSGEYQRWGVYYALKAQRMELERMQAASRGSG